MGLGMALMEETAFDERNGRIMNPSLAEYHIPVHLDVPDIDVIWTDIADPHTQWARMASAKSALLALQPQSQTQSITQREARAGSADHASTNCCKGPTK